MNKSVYKKIFILFLLSMTAEWGLLTADLIAQASNTISNDGTTANSWYVGTDSSAKLGIGIPHEQPLTNVFTVRDSGTAGSQTFITGWLAGSGWKIEPDTAGKYMLTIDDLTIRGTLSVYELLLNRVRATNGNLLVTTSAVVDSVAKDEASFWVTDVTGLNSSPFAEGDLIICQSANISGVGYDEAGNIINNGYLIKRLVYQVSSVNGARVYIIPASGVPVQKNSIKRGDVFCRIGNINNPDRMGVIGLFSDESHSPYLRVTDSVKSWGDWQNPSSVKVQLGKLTGIYDPAFGGQLEGYGLYANNAYIKGKIVVTNPADFSIEMLWDSINNKPAYFNPPEGSGLFISANNMGYYNISVYPSDPWRTYMDNEGRFYLKGPGEHQLSWNGSSLNITGNINLTNTIPVEDITGLGDLAFEDELKLDEIPDGTLYARVLKTDIQSGHIKLSEAIGTIDDIENGIYAKVLSTEINAGHIKITGSDGTTTVINGGKILAGSIKGSEIAAGTILTSNLSFTPVQNTNIVASINASAEGIRISGNKITIDGTVNFGSGYNIADKLDKGDAADDINNNITTIDGGKITTGTISADKIDVANLSAISANLGTITAGTINAATVNVTNINADNIKYGTINADRIGSETITSEKIATGTITASDISSGAITTDKLSAGTLTGFTIQTAPSGQRVVISNNDDISFYDESGSLNTTMKAVGTYHSEFNINSDYNIEMTASSAISFSAGINPSILRIEEDILTFDGQNLATQDWTSSYVNTSSSVSSAALYVSSTYGGSATTQLKMRSIKIGNYTFSVLVVP